MADPTLLIRLHQKARSTVSPTTAPEDLLARAAHLDVVTHDAFIAGRIARAYYAWAQADACLQSISRQAKSHAPNIPSPFCNDAWSKAWTTVHQSHQSLRLKINEIETRLDPIDVQDTDDWDIDLYAEASQAAQEVAGNVRVSSSSMATTENVELPGDQDFETTPAAETAENAVPAEELQSLREHFASSVEKIQAAQLSAIWATWQTVMPPQELLSYDPATHAGHPELATIIQHAKVQLQAMYEAPTSDIASKGKQKATVEWDPGVGSSRESGFDRVASATPPSVFSHDGRLSLQSRTSIESGIASIVTAGSRDTAKDTDSERKSRWPKFKRPLTKLVRRNTRQSDGKTKRASIFSTTVVSKECSSCFDDVSDAVSLRCQHHYCKDCFGGMVMSSSANEAQWPPRCCMIDIPRKLIAVNLSVDQLKIYHAKEQEFSIKPNERWYCTNVPACGLFFTPKVKGEDSTTCTHCRRRMCTFCRGPAHPRGQRCTQDRNLEAMMQEAELEGWRQCIGCSAMVELNTGCRHITCRCGSEFCYTCGAVWRTCHCTERDQERRNEQTRQRRDEARRLEREREEAERRAQEVRDREAEELEAALEAVRQQQEADLAARQRAEEEEARRLEEHRVMAIELTFEELSRMLRQIEMQLLDTLKLRFTEEESSFTHMDEEIHAAVEWERQYLEDLQGKQEDEIRRVEQRHESDMSAFKKKVEKYILKKAMEVDDGSDVSPLDRIMEMREQAGASYQALEEIQQEEISVIRNQHKRVHDSSARRREQIEQGLLREFDGRIPTVTTDNTETEGESRLAHLVKSLEDRKTEHAAATIYAFKWWDCMTGICTAALADRKAHLVSNGADAPEVPEVIIPELPPEPSLPEPSPGLDASSFREVSSAEMPGSFPNEAPARPPPGVPGSSNSEDLTPKRKPVPVALALEENGWPLRRLGESITNEEVTERNRGLVPMPLMGRARPIPRIRS